MSTSNFGILTTFDHSFQSWKTYKGRITQWFIANAISEEDKLGTRRRAILLSALSEGTYKLAEDLALPKKLEDVPFEDILNLLDTHFTPKRIGFAERHNFYAAVQQQGESHNQWAARLRGLTAHCSFTNVEEALRDRFIMGMLPGVEKEKLYSQDLGDLTLAKAVEKAENIRCARAGAAASTSMGGQIVHQSSSMTSRSDQVYKIVQNVKKSGTSNKKKCSVCGFTNHESSKCRYANAVCKKCKTKGHLQKMCTKVNYVDTISELESDDDDDGKLKMYNLRSERGEPMVESVYINGLQLQFEIDSGSAVSVISLKFYNLHFKGVPLSNTNKQLMTYTGDSIPCLGLMNVPVKFREITHKLNIFVVRNGGPPLLGRNFISQFKLELMPVNYCTETDTIQQLKMRFPQLFSNKLGCFNKYEVKLSLIDNAKPVFCKARPIAFALRDKIDTEIDRLVDLGILKPVEHSQYASPIVPVLKRDGSLRLCVDYSISVNKQLVIEKYPLPTAKELFVKLYGGKKFTKLDLSMAYNQFLLSDESQDITCINTHRGLFKYTRLVFGLASAPAIFQRAMECVLSGLEGVLCLLDDVLITGKDERQHIERLNSVLQRLENAGLTLQQEKCEFFKNEICYLGYVINKDGLKKSPQKVKAIVEAPIPTNLNQLQSFLGLINYYRSFVPNISTILSPLYELLKKGNKFNWLAIHTEAFNKIKHIITSDQVLTHFNPDAKIVLTVDASPCGLGAVLSQIDKNEIERPISFASRTLNAAEKRYSQIQKEATAIIFGVRRFHQYLYGRSNPFLLRTDHKPLISIFGPHRGVPEVTANRLQRYALFLSGYNYTIEYIRSSNNCADYLSRASLPDDSTQTGGSSHKSSVRERIVSSADESAMLDRAAYICFVNEGNLPVTLSVLRNETNKDLLLNEIVNYIMNGWPNKISNDKLKPFFLCRTQLSFENGCVMRGHKLVIPEVLRNKILLELHTSHLGIVKTKSEARSRFWFPGIDSAIENMINSCEICIKLRATPPRAAPAPWARPPHAFHRIHIDFLGPINNRTYLVIVDAYSKWVEVYDMSNSTTSTAVIDKLIDFVSRFGLPDTIVSDNGTAFCSQSFEHFCNLNGICHLTSPAYHPASNGQAESFVKIIKKGIRSCLELNNKNQKLGLLKYIFDYRNSIHSGTGLSPAELVFGRKLRCRLDLLTPSSSSRSPPATNVCYDKQCSQNSVKKYNEKLSRKFEKGDIVLYKKFISGNKFEWTKGILVKRIGKVLYLIRDYLFNKEVKKHKNHLIKYKGTVNNRNYWDYDTENSEIYLPDTTSCSSMPPISPGHQTKLLAPPALLKSAAQLPSPPPLSPPPPPPQPSLPEVTASSSLPPLAIPPEAPPQRALTVQASTEQIMTGEEGNEATGIAQPVSSTPAISPARTDDIDQFHEALSDVPVQPPKIVGRSLRKRAKIDYKKFM